MLGRSLPATECATGSISSAPSLYSSGDGNALPPLPSQSSDALVADAGQDAPPAEKPPTEKKRSRCQEKNRRAQARFRERQKSKQNEAQQHLNDLETTIKRLQSERVSTQARVQDLETKLRQGQQTAQLPPVHLDRHTSQPLQHVYPDQQISQPLSQPFVPPQELHHQMHQMRANSATLESTGGGTTWLGQQTSTGGSGWDAPLPALPPMPWENYIVFYRDHIQKMAPLLAHAQADPDSEAARACARLLQELSLASRSMFHRSPELRDKVHTQPLVLDGADTIAPPDIGLWRQVTAALQMTPGQQAHARQLHMHYWQRMADIMAERHSLSLAMLGTAELLLPGLEVLSPGTLSSNQSVASKHSQALQTMAALSRNIAAETLMQIEVGHGLFCKVLTPLQACSCYVGTFPLFPDKLAILDCVLELEDQACQNEDAVRSLVSELIAV